MSQFNPDVWGHHGGSGGDGHTRVDPVGLSHLGLKCTTQVGGGVCVSLSVQSPIRWVFLLVCVRWWRCLILSLHCRGALGCGATEPGCCPITCCLPAAGQWVLQDQHTAWGRVLSLAAPSRADRSCHMHFLARSTS